MMKNNIKENIEEVKRLVRAEDVESLIVSDRGIQIQNGKCACWMHSNSAKTAMAFDSEHKRFKCFSCGATYDIFDHYIDCKGYSNFIEAMSAIVSDFNLGIDINVNAKSSISPKSNKKFAEATTYGGLTERTSNYITKRGISAFTAAKLGLKSDKNNNVVFEYRDEYGNLLANKYRFLSKNASPKMMFEKDTNRNTLFNMNRIDVTKPVAITEGEFDCCALIEAGFDNAVSVPTGCQSEEWIKVCYDWLEQIPEVILFFDNDEPGLEGATKVANRLPNIVKVAKIPHEDISDINELLVKKGAEEVIACVKKAQSPAIDGVKTFRDIGDWSIYEAEGIETGFNKIDSRLVKIPYGSLVMLSGRPGSGKSTLINQMCLAEPISQGIPAFVYSGELTAANVKSWALRTMANDNDFIEKTNKYGDKYHDLKPGVSKRISDELGDSLHLYDMDDDHSIEAILQRMEKLYKRYGTRVFVLDNLMTIDSPGKDENEQQAYTVKALKKFAKDKQAIVYLVAHPRKTYNDRITDDDIAGTSKIKNLADYIILIHRITDKERDESFVDADTANITWDAELDITKNRYTGVTCAMRMWFNDKRKRFSDAPVEEFKVYNFNPVDEYCQGFVELEGAKSWEQI